MNAPHSLHLASILFFLTPVVIVIVDVLLIVTTKTFNDEYSVSQP